MEAHISEFFNSRSIFLLSFDFIRCTKISCEFKSVLNGGGIFRFHLCKPFRHLVVAVVCVRKKRARVSWSWDLVYCHHDYYVAHWMSCQCSIQTETKHWSHKKLSFPINHDVWRHTMRPNQNHTRIWSHSLPHNDLNGVVLCCLLLSLKSAFRCSLFFILAFLRPRKLISSDLYV